MKSLNTILMVLLLGMLSGSAYAGSGLCGDGTYDPIIGQYTGSHLDGSDATNVQFNVGGTGNIADQVTIGGGDWWTTGVGQYPTGSPGFGTLTWKKIKNGTYALKPMVLAGVPSPLSSLGAFPINTFYRIVANVNVTLSSDCRTAEAYVTKICTFNADAQVDLNVNHNVNTASGNCQDLSSNPTHLLTLYKVAP